MHLRRAWQHTLRCLYTAAVVAAQKTSERRHRAFLKGLLHRTTDGVLGINGSSWITVNRHA
ncbi:hypothetical protein [Duganella sp. Dugasp56]|uniref:hypothetical protein n=1 Tax=Duganella sp. Dugasp56 TaxID=3243046 RepID=UPI0039B126FB